MKVLFFVGSLKFGGAERVASDVANALAAKGVDVHLAMYNDVLNYPLDERIALHRLWPRVRSTGVLFFVQVYFRLMILLLRLRPRYAIAPSLLSGVVLAFTFYPRVITRFDTYILSIRNRRKRRMVFTAFNLPNVTRVVCPSAELREDVSPFFFRKSKLAHIYNFVDIPAENSGARGHYFVSVGRLHPQKQISVVLEAFAASRLRESYRYVIVGDGKVRRKLEDRARSLGIADRVDFTGNRTDAGRIIAGAAFLVSASEKEGFPNVLIEALSLGVPVIAADCKTGPKEIVSPGSNGFLFPVGDAGALARLMDNLLDESLMIHLRKHAQPSAFRFEKATILKQWFALFELPEV